VKGNDAETDTSAEGAGDRRPDGPAVLRQRWNALEVVKQEGSMKTFIRGWEYEPPALQDFTGLVFILAFIGTFVFKGPMADGIFVLCVIVLIATNRRGWEHMTPFRWVMLTAILVTTVDYVVDTAVTHTAQRTVMWLWIVWYTANRFHIRPYWRDPGNDQPF
jgi:hypothetical protein